MAKLGIKCKLYLNTGTYGSPTWAEVKCIRDFKQTKAWQTGDVGSRKSRVNKKVKTTLDLSWSGTYEPDEGAESAAIAQAADTDRILDLMILDGKRDANGVTGIRADCQVTKADTDQGRETVIYPEIEIFITESANDPKWATVTSGAPVFTAIDGEVPD